MFVWLLACSAPTDCRDGFTAGDDGLCYEDAAAPVGDDTGEPEEDTAPPTVDDVLAALPACEPVAADGRIDLYTGCADGVCTYDTYDDAAAILGEPDCYGFYYELDGYVGGSLECTWSNGVSLGFDDEDRDGVADPGSYAYGLTLSSAFDGGTETGVGIGANVACFLDELGAPTSASFDLVDGEWYVYGASWDWAGVYAYDRYDRRGDRYPDGYVDGLSLYGASGEL